VVEKRAERDRVAKQMKELRFSDHIAEHDVQVKVRQLRRWLSHPTRHPQVKLSVIFKQPGSHSDVDVELAKGIIQNVASRVADLGHVQVTKDSGVSRSYFGVQVSALLEKYTPVQKAQYEAELAAAEQQKRKEEVEAEAEDDSSL
jgi:translation initiation factor IF-3